ncbi:hypothetical protein GCM10007914_34980 [Pseudoalteromonas tetraodonis GFC]|uniref:Uncharacterized protein n=1 Tax=Pseudoalteromonas tetraodonis GFC TaxID=1315271 RepID=A0AA37S688_9GAMM|nr:hypothetical protein GCM10007914_34980 [Pseudoalteromonas tetraodonis GFC]
MASFAKALLESKATSSKGNLIVCPLCQIVDYEHKVKVGLLRDDCKRIQCN